MWTYTFSCGIVLPKAVRRSTNDISASLRIKSDRCAAKGRQSSVINNMHNRLVILHRLHAFHKYFLFLLCTKYDFIFFPNSRIVASLVYCVQ